MATDDLFVWLDALWTKRKLEGTFPLFVAHRFLASEQAFAEPARVLWREVRDPALVFATWQGLLPTGRGSPRLSYPAPKKSAAAEELTRHMMAVLGERRATVETMQRIIGMAGRALDLYYEYGVEPPEELVARALDDGAPRKRSKQAEPPPDGGLLGQV